MTTTSAEKTVLNNPAAETFLEVLFVLAASWIPIIWGSFTSGEPVSGYLNKGEITLLVIGLCGSIFFLLSIRGFPIQIWVRGVISLLVVFVIFFPSASALGKNPNFRTPISDGEFYYLVLMYGLAVILFFYCSWKSKKLELPSPEAAAKQEADRTAAIVDGAKSRRK